MRSKAPLILFLLCSFVFLMCSLFLLSFLEEAVTERFTNTNKISSYNQLYVNTTAGHVRLADSSGVRGQPYNSTGLVLWMHMDEESETNVQDSSGQGNNGTLYGDTDEWIDGKFGKALEFDGEDDYVEVSADSTIDAYGKSALTLSAWIYPKSDGEADEGKIMGKWGGYRFFVWGETGGTVRLACLVGLSASHADARTSTTLSINKWHHVAGVFNASGNNKIKIYIDGNLAALSTDQAGIGSMNDDSANNLRIGTLSASTGDAFDGAIDEVRIYNRALNSTEIAENGGSYRSEGILYSTNLLYNLKATEIIGFSVDVSISNSEEIEIQFSQDNSTWVNKYGTSGWEKLSDGVNTFDLQGLSWKGNFYCRANFSTYSLTHTPELNSITLTYSTSTTLRIILRGVAFIMLGVNLAIAFSQGRGAKLLSLLPTAFSLLRMHITAFLRSVKMFSVRIKTESKLMRYFRESFGVPFIVGFQVLLLACAVLSVQGDLGLASEVAVYAYYLLVIGVVLQLISLVLHGKEAEQKGSDE